MQNFERQQPEGKDGNKDLKWVSSCPLCATEYAPEEARIVSEKEGAFLVYTNCKKCGSSVIATLIANQMGISSVGLITDLTYDDVVKFKDCDSISTDDILNVYEFFQKKESVKALIAG
ncbi:hypothetical protein KKC60_03555 [Patescibacteria group bacterium]|nr:hypothetical protein [Patescibacteria group bacterium]